MKISVFFYSALAFVIISGVMFGLDWQPATLSPMAPIQVVALPPAPPPPTAVPKPTVPKPTVPSPAITSPVATSLAGPKVAAPSPAAPSPAAPSPAAPAAAPPPKPLCDIAACTQAYHSFTASDCTYLSSSGRKLCTKGVVPTAAAPPVAPASSDAPPPIMQEEHGAQSAAPANTQAGTQAGAKCNVSACATAYRTFTESDCTFMASGGVRKLCTK
jgi:hypothetical protein